MLLSIIIPIYNEKDKLPQLIRTLKNNFAKHQIIIVDDGSTAGTKDYLKHHDCFDIIHINPKRGKGNAKKVALKKVKHRSVLLIDGDLEIDVASLKRDITLDKNLIVVGNRWEHFQNINFQRFGNYILNSLFNLIYKTNYKDILCCVKLIPTELIQSLNLRSNGFDIETEIMAKLSLSKREIIEIPVYYSGRTRKEGKKIKFIDSISIIKRMLSTRFSYS